MSFLAKPWFDFEDCFDHVRPEQEQLYHLACAKFRQTHGYDPDDDSVTDAQRIEFSKSIWQIPAELKERCFQMMMMKDKTIPGASSAGTNIQNNTTSASKTESGNGNAEETEPKTPSTINDNGAVQDHPEGAHSECKQEGQESQKKSINSDDGSEFSLDNKSTSVSNNSSQISNPISQDDAKECGLIDLLTGEHTEEQLASKGQSTPDDWPDWPVEKMPSKDRMDTNIFLLKRLQHWKDTLAAKKRSSPDNENEQNLSSDILDFNASMLGREDYDQMLRSVASNKQSDENASNSTREEVSSFELSTAINALLFGLTVLKAATPVQQHEMATSLLHPKVRKMQPSLVFEMNALLLELDTQKLLAMSVDEDALHARAKKVARDWGVELSSLEDGPSGLSW